MSDELHRMKARINELCADEAEHGAACGWMACSGCHETNEGYSTGYYFHSDVFGCEVGSGCTECGGLGVVWEYWSERDLAEMQSETAAEERRQLENEEMARHFEKHPHG